MAPLSTYQVALSGFQDARTRLAQAAILGTGRAIITGLEALYWASVLDVRLRADDSGYTILAGPQADLMLGLQWAQNRVAHQIPMTTVDSVIRWEAHNELLPEHSGHINSNGQAAYRDQIEMESVPGVFDQVARWFATEQQRPDSPIAQRKSLTDPPSDVPA